MTENASRPARSLAVVSSRVVFPAPGGAHQVHHVHAALAKPVAVAARDVVVLRQHLALQRNGALGRGRRLPGFGIVIVIVIVVMVVAVVTARTGLASADQPHHDGFG